VEGYEELTLALDSGATPVELFVAPALFRDPAQAALATRAAQAGAAVFEFDERAFRKMAYRQRPDGWLATVRFTPRRLDDLALGGVPLVVVGEALEKPGNLGAILRTADAAGVDAVVSCEPHTDWGNPNVVRASKGAVFAVPVAEASSEETIAWLRRRGVRIVVASPRAGTVYTSADFTRPVAIAVGTEKEGLTQAWFDAADDAVVIPMRGRVNSLNVATATALLLYEAVRQRA
jgi:TrmH family RNA methyltransferase